MRPRAVKKKKRLIRGFGGGRGGAGWDITNFSQHVIKFTLSHIPHKSGVSTQRKLEYKILSSS
jgi:hypothetical protein